MDTSRNSSSRSLRSCSQQRGGSVTPAQTNHHQQWPLVHAHHQHMSSGVPQPPPPPPPPPASTSRSAHKVPATSTAVTPEEALGTRRSKRIGAMAHHPHFGSDYPSSGKLLFSFRWLPLQLRRDFHGNQPGKTRNLCSCCLYVVHLFQGIVCQQNSPSAAQRHVIECLSRVIAMRIEYGLFSSGI